mmetsp:Transcript_65259/g.153658  ORF Transcript_65259/g.153658 Transcript_65259/m.153658 type:complete len:225 (-) Transcript_65259:118-792(-)
MSQEVPATVLPEEFNIWTPLSSPRSTRLSEPAEASSLFKQRSHSCCPRSKCEDGSSQTTADGSEAVATLVSAQEAMIENLLGRCRQLEALVSQQRADLVAQSEQVRSLRKQQGGRDAGGRRSPSSARPRVSTSRAKADSKTGRAAAGIAQKVQCQEYQHPLRTLPTSRRGVATASASFRPPSRGALNRGRSTGALSQKAGVSVGFKAYQGQEDRRSLGQSSFVR